MSEEDLLNKMREYETYLTAEIDNRGRILERENSRPFYKGQSQQLQRVGDGYANFSNARDKLYHLFPELKPKESK